MTTIYLHPETELRDAGACTCEACLADYPVLAEYAIECASNAEGVSIRVRLERRPPDHAYTLIEGDLIGVIRDIIADRVYPYPCGRSSC